jgi:hypothetical protein
VSAATRDTGRRLPSLLLLLLHVIVAGLAPLADALTERDALDNTVHVESESSPSCPIGHDHLECQLCRHVATALDMPRSISIAQQSLVVIEPESAGAWIRPIPADGCLPLGPRAPPLA